MLEMNMRRALAITIVFLIGFSMTAPLFAVGATDSIPLCCRRNGSHHCAGSTTPDQDSRAISTIGPKCPNWPKSTPAPRPNDLASTQAQGISTSIYTHPASAPQIEARYRVAFARSRQKRGPPAISL
jgi:hypothetical protein